MRLIHNWRQAPRMNSVQMATLLALLSGLQAEALPHLQMALPHRWWLWISAGLALLIVLLRLRAQPEIDDGRAAGSGEAPK
jgi:predicted benzoate:H+ symporter BenE